MKQKYYIYTGGDKSWTEPSIRESPRSPDVLCKILQQVLHPLLCFRFPRFQQSRLQVLKLPHLETLNSFLIFTECSEIYTKAAISTVKFNGEYARRVTGSKHYLYSTSKLAFSEQIKILLSCSSSFIHKTTNFIIQYLKNRTAQNVALKLVQKVVMIIVIKWLLNYTKCLTDLMIDWVTDRPTVVEYVDVQPDDWL